MLPFSSCTEGGPRETPHNGARDRAGAATGVSFIKRRLAEDTVPPMHPDRWWACTVGGVPLQSAAKSSPIELKASSSHFFCC